MRKLYVFLILASASVFLLQSARAQYVKPQFKSYWWLGAKGGTNLFFGDNKQYDFYPVFENRNEWGWGTSLVLGRQISPSFGLRLQGLYGEVYGTKRKADRYFNAEILEANLSAVFNFSNMFFGYKPDRFLSVYGFVGAGATNFRTRVEQLSTGNLIDKRGYEGDYGLVGTAYAAVVPAGLGFDLGLSRNLKLNLEFTTRGISNDDLDDWADNFPFDFYSFNSIGISWQFKGPQTYTRPEESTQPDFGYLESEDENENEEPEEEKSGFLDYQEIQNKSEEGMSEEQEVIKEEPEPVVEEEVSYTEEEVVEQEPFQEEAVYTGKVYRVQIIAKQEGKLNVSKFKADHGLNMPMEEFWHNGYYIYTVGEFESFNDALGLRSEMIQKHGLPGAFVAIFENGERIN